MSTEIIVAIIAGSATVIAALITGLFSLASKKAKSKESQRIQGNGNIQAGRNIKISGGLKNNVESNNKRT